MEPWIKRRVVKVGDRWMTFEQTVQTNQSQALYHAAKVEAQAMVDAIGRNASSHKGQLEGADVSGVIRQAVVALQTGLVEREVEVKLLLLTVLCREHVLVKHPRTIATLFPPLTPPIVHPHMQTSTTVPAVGAPWHGQERARSTPRLDQVIHHFNSSHTLLASYLTVTEKAVD